MYSDILYVRCAYLCVAQIFLTSYVLNVQAAAAGAAYREVREGAGQLLADVSACHS